MSFKGKLKNEFDKQILIGDSNKVKGELLFEKRKNPFFKKGLSLSLATIVISCSLVIIILAANGINNNDLLSKSYINSCINYQEYDNYKNIVESSEYSNTLKTKCNSLTVDSDLIEEIQATGINTENVEGYISEYSSVETGYITYNMPIWGTASSLIYPGSLIRVDVPESNKNLVSFGLNTGDIVISTSQYTSTGTNGYIFRKIKNATLSNTKEAISSILKDMYVDGSNHACETYFSTYEIKNVSQLKMALGFANDTLDTKVASFVSSVSERINNYESSQGTTKFNSLGESIEITNSNTYSEERSFTLVEFTQKFYDIDVDLIMNPSEIISKKNTKASVKNAFSKDGVGAYISTVSYGRKAIFVFESSESYSDFVNVTGTNDDKLNVISEKSSIINRFSLVTGMDYDTSNKLTLASTVDEIKNILFNSTYDAKSYVSSPISYNMKYIDGSNATVGFGNIRKHYLKTSTKI